MTERIYVIVQTGDEGIDALLWAGTNADEARAVVLDVRERHTRHGIEDPDQVCVMSKGENMRFVCYCAALSVRPSKLMLS